MTEYHIEAHWDDEAKVWVATSEDVPGLATEAETMEALMDKLRVMIPELLELSGITPSADIPFRLHAERSDAARPV
jgi:predicted RNase H-like HicB family nuclease